jgi:hypothetical protein
MLAMAAKGTLATTAADAGVTSRIFLPRECYFGRPHPIRRVFATVGGLMYYGIDPVANFHRAPTYVVRILMGEKRAICRSKNQRSFALG